MSNENIEIKPVQLPYGDRYRVHFEVHCTDTMAVVEGNVQRKITQAVGRINRITYKKDELNWAGLEKDLDIPELLETNKKLRAQVANRDGQIKRLRNELMVFRDGQENEKGT